MLDGLFLLLTLSVVMALASFLAGALPLSMTLSSSQLRLISSIGMGVLVGTSLIVIIPEGIEEMYSSTSAHSHVKRYTNLERRLGIRWTPQEVAQIQQRNTVSEWDSSFAMGRDLSEANAINSLPGPVIPATDSIPPTTGSGEAHILDELETTKPDAPATSHEGESKEADSPTFYIGFSLITGFILMYLIDKLPRLASENFHPPAPTRHISLNNLSEGLASHSTEEEDESFLRSLAPTPKQTRSLATTTGLVIHAAADGIAMGASASTSDTKLGFIVFIAILVHKAPAAFGLTSVLLKQGLSKRAARGHLVIFSLAAPFGALATWLLANLLGGGLGFSSDDGAWWTGMLLLFSAGTFLYVAMHAMQDDAATHEHAGLNGYLDGSAQRKPVKPQMRDTLASVVGMLIPLLTQIGHHH